MSAETEFVSGLIVKAPHENAPEYVKARLSIRREELIAWLNTKEGEWINADVKVSQGGKWYAAVDNWKPERSTRSGSSSSRAGTAQRQRQAQPASSPRDDFNDDDIPF